MTGYQQVEVRHKTESFYFFIKCKLLLTGDDEKQVQMQAGGFVPACIGDDVLPSAQKTCTTQKNTLLYLFLAPIGIGLSCEIGC